ncbi:MAG: 30S ribosomal protein S2 [Planctomycetota bacterium]
MALVKVRELLEAGVHFGSRTSQWNPKMTPYIYGKRSKIHIIDVRQTLRGLVRACKFIESVAARGEKVIFVGTKRPAQETVRSEARRAGQFFVAQRWLGGTLTNLRTIRERVARLEELEALEASGEIQRFSKKMISTINRERRKISRNFEGIREMTKMPGAVILVDPKEEHIALAEALKVGISIVAVADTDCDPEPIDFVIPANDDAIRSVEVLVRVLADACLAGTSRMSEMAMIAARGGDLSSAGPGLAAEIDASAGAVTFGGKD